MKKLFWLFTLGLVVASISVMFASQCLADAPPLPSETVVTNLVSSTNEDVLIPIDGEWATLKLEITNAPPSATVMSTDFKFGIGYVGATSQTITFEPGWFQAVLASDEHEYELPLESAVEDQNGVYVWTVEGIEDFVDLPIHGTWLLMVKGPEKGDIPALDGGNFYIDGMTIRNEYEAEMPVVIEVTDGVPGTPSEIYCPECGEVLSSLSAIGGGESPNTTMSLSGWESLEVQDFEGDFPDPDPGSGDGPWWYAFPNAGAIDAKWGKDNIRPYGGEWAAWPAVAGAEAGDPSSGNYPNSMDSWMSVGPLDLTGAANLSVSFKMWIDIEPGWDWLHVLVTTDGQNYSGWKWSIDPGAWFQETVYWPNYGPGSDYVWVVWRFESDLSNLEDYEGVWIDDIEISKANPCPAAAFDNDPGYKGLNVHPSVFHTHPTTFDLVEDADVDWVRLEFIQEDGSVNLEDYDYVVDTLCDNGITVVGLVDHQTVPYDWDGEGLPPWNDPSEATNYRNGFAGAVQGLANYFKGRIRYWEIWNEENAGFSPPDAITTIDPVRYAPLLKDSYDAIKYVAPSPDSEIVFGGMERARGPGEYLNPVYDEFDQMDWFYTFDLLGIHPYFTMKEGSPILNPNTYLRDIDDYNTILDPYLESMGQHWDLWKDILVTEIGWNSALGNPALDPCPAWFKERCVNPVTQARYLKESWDILFLEVRDPSGMSYGEVEKNFWYEYRDTTQSISAMQTKMLIPPDRAPAELMQVCPADWGIVDGNKNPKVSYWQYQIYPNSLNYSSVYLPIVLKSYGSGTLPPSPSSPYPPPTEPKVVPQGDPYPPPSP